MRTPVQITLAVLAATCGFSQAAQAQRPELTRTWSLMWVRGSGAESCLGAAELMRRTVDRLGVDPFRSPTEADLHVEGQIAATSDSSFTVRFVVGDASGAEQGYREMEVEASDCRELDEAVVLMAVMTVDPAVAPQAAVDPPHVDAPATEEVPAARVARPEDPPVREPADTEAPEPRSAARVDLSLGAVAVPGMLPPPALGLAFAAEVAPIPRLAVSLGAAFIPQTKVTTQGGRVGLSLAALSLSVCPAVALGERWRLSACAGAEVDWIRAEGRGYATDLTAARTLVSVGSRAVLTVDVSPRAFVGVAAGGQVPVTRPRFTVEDAATGASSQAHRPAAVTGTLGVYAGLHLR